MKDPSPPLDVCPFCGKAFKRLKSHLPHCRMAETKNTTVGSDPGDHSRTANHVSMKTETKNTIVGSDPGDHSRTANHVSMKRTGTTLPNVDKNDMKAKGKSKTGLKSQIRQDKTISSSQTTAPKGGKVTSGNMLTQQKAVVTIKESKKATTRTNHRVTSPKERDQQEVVSPPIVPIQQSPLSEANLERTVPFTVEGPRLANTETLRDQVSTTFFEGDLIRLSMPDRISEKYIAESSGRGQPQVHLDQNFVSRVSAGDLMELRWPTNVPEKGTKTQILAISRTGCDRAAEMNSKALGTNEKSSEIKMDVLVPPKTVPIADGSLGLQWVPQLYPNYVQLRVVPGRQDQREPLGRGTRMPDPRGSLPGTGTRMPDPRGSPPEEVSKIARTQSILENQRLMDVRLGELPLWLANHSFTPKNLPLFMANAWGRYYNKYINVKKGGAGGLTMLLAGYCVLSYSWNYDHIKQDRWRKYH